METRIQKVNPENFDDRELDDACLILKREGLVAFPTETVYGLGADAMKEKTSKKIYEAKGRPSDNPLIIHIAETESVYRLAKVVSGKAERLMKAFWPGPLTIIFEKRKEVPYSTTGGLDTVAVRMPSHPVARALIRCSGILIAAPSANTSGRPSPTKAEHVIEDLSGRIDMILDGGQVGIGIESTIIDMTEEVPVILRPGYVTKAMLEEVIGEVAMDAALLKKPTGELRPKAPGMKYRHYAPKGKMTIVEGRMEDVVREITNMAEKWKNQGKKVAVIATEESKELYPIEEVYSIGSRKNEASIAAGLYDILRKMDHIGAEYIFAESFPEEHLGHAIMNRLLKAAGYQKVKV